MLHCTHRSAKHSDVQKVVIMAGTRTAPTVGALTVTENLVSVGLVDTSGDVFNEALTLPGGALTDMADIEAFVAAYQPTTQASIFRVVQQVVWLGAKDPDNANNLFRAGVENGINLLLRNTTASPAAEFTGRVVAPVATIMQGNQDIPLLVTPLTALVTQYINMLPDYALESMQFTGRRERKNNPRIAT
ncbi:MAG TPA: hypothetical protein VJM50_24670 [Pyrinomonadaceae bacterium]|nr:hypothetical protein [Pyrinomonadaceae bacterium]